MPHVTFFGGGMTAPAVCEYEPDGQLTVLSLARRHQLPLWWRCGLGTCGTCAVRISVLEGAPQPMASKERNVLARAEKPPQARWRLACSHPLSGESLMVEW